MILCRVPYWPSNNLGGYWCCSSRTRWAFL